ncbi:hypothetical protein [Flavobacterium defluvii]|uniref:Uncharacterized protein n=1 Tax=Flavobacterium defluvii TaxID=370979 RepID=A0A1M5KW19_9FLAO|nr:hypothetical protein [Flavobacterium defluvii]SHG56998.1 hypothetical protein SAMN05443663_103200 [Flavobacterium defluvii]
MEKFEIDLKWGSYLFIANMVSTICIVLLIFLINSYSFIYLSDILIPIFIIQLIYFTIKAIRENRKYDLSKGFRKIFVFTRLLVFYFMLISFSDGRTNIWCFSLLLPYRKKDISELIQDDSNEEDEITLKEFMVRLKRKFSRP